MWYKIYFCIFSNCIATAIKETLKSWHLYWEGNKSGNFKLPYDVIVHHKFCKLTVYIIFCPFRGNKSICFQEKSIFHVKTGSKFIHQCVIPLPWISYFWVVTQLLRHTIFFSWNLVLHLYLYSQAIDEQVERKLNDYNSMDRPTIDTHAEVKVHKASYCIDTSYCIENC